MLALRSVGICALCALLVFETGAIRFAHASEAVPAAAPAEPPSDKDREGLPRWAWITIAAVGAAAALALIFAFVVVPAAANNAGRAAANGAGDSGRDGSVLP